MATDPVPDPALPDGNRGRDFLDILFIGAPGELVGERHLDVIFFFEERPGFCDSRRCRDLCAIANARTEQRCRFAVLEKLAALRRARPIDPELVRPLEIALDHLIALDELAVVPEHVGRQFEIVQATQILAHLQGRINRILVAYQAFGAFRIHLRACH